MKQISNLAVDKCQTLHCAREHRTHVDGTFYQMPTNFPFVLHDRNGCILIEEDFFHELARSSLINISTGGSKNKINIRNGISKVSAYKVCQHKNECPKYRPRGK